MKTKSATFDMEFRNEPRKPSTLEVYSCPGCGIVLKADQLEVMNRSGVARCTYCNQAISHSAK